MPQSKYNRDKGMCSGPVVQQLGRRSFNEVLDVRSLKVSKQSLRNVPKEERRKEAIKPLYLVRYE